MFNDDAFKLMKNESLNWKLTYKSLIPEIDTFPLTFIYGNSLKFVTVGEEIRSS